MNPWREVMVALCGCSISAIGALTLVSKMISQVQWSRWFGDPVGMATNTAIAFILSVASIILMSCDMTKHQMKMK